MAPIAANLTRPNRAAVAAPPPLPSLPHSFCSQLAYWERPASSGSASQNQSANFPVPRRALRIFCKGRGDFCFALRPVLIDLTQAENGVLAYTPTAIF